MKKIKEGYMTVEAATLLTTILVIVLFLLYIMFFQYDRALLETELNLITCKGAFLKNISNEERIEYIKLLSREDLSDLYLAFEMEDTNCSVKNSNVEFEIDAYCNFPFGTLLEDIPNKFDTSVKSKSAIMTEADFLRLCRDIHELINKIKEEENDSN